MWRVKIVFTIFLASFLAVIFRLFYWQIVKGEELSIYARSQQQINSQIKAKRGDILSADGSWLSASMSGWEVNLEVEKLNMTPGEASEIISKILVEKRGDEEEDKINQQEEKERIYNLISGGSSKWKLLKTKVKSEQRSLLEESGVEGLVYSVDELREYPESSAAAHLLGFVGKDDDGNDRGYFGLEGYYDIILSGKPGFLNRERDALGNPIASLKGKNSEAIGGTSLLTYVDRGAQIILDSKLKEGVEKYQAVSGIAVIMDPKTGGILGMSAYPGYDPRYYNEYESSLFLNPIISSSFEPGSIFKVIVMASSINEAAVEPETKCDICSGPVKVDGYDIETWNQKYRPESTMTDVIVNSDNVGMVFAARKLGKEKLIDYIQNFGFGEKTGIDLQGEASPAIRKRNDWKEIDLATASFGQGIAVTPIQMLRAVSAIANKGVLVEPRVVQKFVGEGWQSETSPSAKKQVISEKTALKVISMMSEAAERGEAKWTYRKGYRVAGKTGTAQIPIAGHYDAEKTAASFIGFAPWDDPKFVMLVTLFEPQSSPWASETAAPLWYDVAEHLFVKFGIHPDKN